MANASRGQRDREGISPAMSAGEGCLERGGSGGDWSISEPQQSAAANMSPEPLSNWALSFGEDILAVWLAWFSTAHPTLAIIVVVVLVIISLFLLYHLFRFLRRTFEKLAET